MRSSVQEHLELLVSTYYVPDTVPDENTPL